MSLPFLKPKMMGAVIEVNRKKSGEMEPMNEEGGHGPGIMSAAEDLISAVHAKDSHAVADALMAIFDMHEAEEDEEPSSGAV